MMVEISVEVGRLMAVGCHDEGLVMEVDWDSAVRFVDLTVVVAVVD